ncbi:golgin candidate 6-like [Tasmannia lanceolata]|uniref:golgin candidate 6-like n=1 Tax=Tasmannia lanceolata TaxID=3420 RepID=UPI004062F220
MANFRRRINQFAELEQKGGERDVDYIKRLKLFLEKQCSEILDLLGRNATLAEDLAKSGGCGASSSNQKVHGGTQFVTLRRDLQDAMQHVEMLKSEKAKIEADALMYQNLVVKLESNLKSLLDAYNSLEQANFLLD